MEENRPSPAAGHGALLRLSRRYLLSLYLVIPLFAAIAACDSLLWDGRLRARIDFTSDQLLACNLFFNLPHIFASALMLLDSEYLSSYRRKLRIGVGLAACGALALPSAMGRAFPLFFAVLTMSHVIGQQFGLTRAFARVEGPSFQGWKGLGTALGLATFVALYIREIAPRTVLWACAGLAPPFLLLSFRLSRRSGDRIGRAYLWANTALPLAGAALYLAGYPLLVTLMPRFLHDVTAFSFYVVHDRNRNAPAPRQWIYRGLARFPVPISALAIGIPLGAALPLTLSLGKAWAFYAAHGISLFHYYTESFAWKSGTPLRRWIAFS